MFRAIDEDGNGQIEFSEFLSVVMEMRQDSDTPEQITASFKELAANRDTITEEQMRQLMEPEDVDYLTSKMDADEDGGYDYKTFVKVAYGQQEAGADYYAKPLKGLTPRERTGGRKSVGGSELAASTPAVSSSVANVQAEDGQIDSPVILSEEELEKDETAELDDLDDLELPTSGDEEPMADEQQNDAAGEDDDELFHTLMYVTEAEEASDELNMDEVRELLDAGEITDDTLCWTEGMENWVPWSECMHLFAGFAEEVME